MEYTVIEEDTQKKVNEIRRRIRRLQNRGCIDSLEKIGVNTQGQVGASYLSLKKLAGQYEADEKVASLLWATQQREEQIIACFLLPKKIIKEKITQLMHLCSRSEIAEYFGSVFLFQHAELPEIAREWSNSSIPFLQTAALTACARHLLLNKEKPEISPDFFKTLVNKDYEDPYVRLVAGRYK